MTSGEVTTTTVAVILEAAQQGFDKGYDTGYDAGYEDALIHAIDVLNQNIAELERERAISEGLEQQAQEANERDEEIETTSTSEGYADSYDDEYDEPYYNDDEF